MELGRPGKKLLQEDREKQWYEEDTSNCLLIGGGVTIDAVVKLVSVYMRWPFYPSPPFIGCTSGIVT